jgi:4-diphosphocytidyl-2-C-methyl-D-erythritol kinase
MSEHSARTTAQAKINLFLHVGGLLPSAYHEIRTLFQRVDLGDDVLVSAFDSRERSIECRGMRAGRAEDNIAFRAAELYSERCGWPAGFSIEIDKRVPVGGGLGGGSADAAAVLRVLNTLAPRPVTAGDLLDIAVQLGSDVPFLTSDSCLALAEGRGERMIVLQPLPIRGVILFQLPLSVNTADAYAWIDVSRGAGGASKRDALPMTTSAVTSWEDVARLAHNDFEEVVASRHVELGTLLKSVRALGYQMAAMTGSGATVFAISLNDEPSRAPRHLVPGVRQLLTRTASTPATIERL